MLTFVIENVFVMESLVKTNGKVSPWNSPLCIILFLQFCVLYIVGYRNLIKNYNKGSTIFIFQFILFYFVINVNQ